MSAYKTLDRQFGKCPVKGCKTRRVVESPMVAGISIYDRGNNHAELIGIDMWCSDHMKAMVWTPLKGRYSAEKECNGVCMAGVGPSCDCSCGGENHGKNHVSI